MTYSKPHASGKVRHHPYASARRPLYYLPRAPSPPSDPAQNARDEQERELASGDLMAGRMNELFTELEQANQRGVIFTYDKDTQGWANWFR